MLHSYCSNLTKMYPYETLYSVQNPTNTTLNVYCWNVLAIVERS